MNKKRKKALMLRKMGDARKINGDIRFVMVRQHCDIACGCGKGGLSKFYNLKLDFAQHNQRTNCCYIVVLARHSNNSKGLMFTTVVENKRIMLWPALFNIKWNVGKSVACEESQLSFKRGKSGRLDSYQLHADAPNFVWEDGLKGSHPGGVK